MSLSEPELSSWSGPDTEDEPRSTGRTSCLSGTYVWRAGARLAVHGLQLGVVEQGLQVRAGEPLRRRRQRFHLHVCCHGNAGTQSLQDLQPSLLRTRGCTGGRMEPRGAPWAKTEEIPAGCSPGPEAGRGETCPAVPVSAERDRSDQGDWWRPARRRLQQHRPKMAEKPNLDL